MSDRTDALRGLVQAAMGLARRTTSGTVGLSRVAGVIDDDMVPEVIRPEVRRTLDAAHAQAAEPLSAKAVDRALKAAWGTAPSKVVDELDPEPLSVSGLAQVHAAALDGEPVVVKVARPGVAQAVRSELTLLDLLAAPIGAVFGALDVGGVLREVREAAADELDLEHEGDQQARVRRALRRLDGVVVPAVHDEHTASGALVSERLDGHTLASGARPDDPGAVARALVTACLVAWKEAGLVITDLRPSHVVLMDDGRVGLLGAGVARAVPREHLAPAVRGFAALADADPAAFVAAALEQGVLGAEDAATAHGLLREILGDLVTGGPALLDGPTLAAAGERAYERLGAGLALGARATPQPDDLPALRMLGQLGATLAHLGATEDWAQVALDALSD